jgi:hypothetical protein
VSSLIFDHLISCSIVDWAVAGVVICCKRAKIFRARDLLFETLELNGLCLIIVLLCFVVKVTVNSRLVSVTGTRGTLKRDFGHIQVDLALVGEYAFSFVSGFCEFCSLTGEGMKGEQDPH